MSTYEPGTVAVATVRGVPNVRVMSGAESNGPKPLVWATSRAINGNWWFTDAEVTDVRPLVVLDLALHDVTPERMAQFVIKAMHALNHTWADHVADQLIEQTRTPKPAAPKGLGAVVEDSDGVRWVRMTDDGDVNKHWRRADMAAVQRHWQIVDAVKVLSNGVDQ